MSNIVPSRRPQLTYDELLEKLITDHPDFKIPDFLVIGIRGYYKKTTGYNPDNERNIYDDAIFLVCGNEMKAFNANTDPSAFKKEMANLKPGIWPCYCFAQHRGQYLAICQRIGPVTVIRDQKGPDTGMFGINIHRGGNWKTSSLGCQTIPPVQWEDFISTAKAYAKKAFGKGYEQKVITYVLLEN